MLRLITFFLYIKTALFLCMEVFQGKKTKLNGIHVSHAKFKYHPETNYVLKYSFIVLPKCHNVDIHKVVGGELWRN